MTVCIAATYSYPDMKSQGIAIATDWQLTDQSTGIRSETGVKLDWIPSQPHSSGGIVAIGADDIDLFHDLIRRTRIEVAKSSRPMSVAEVAQQYLKVEGQWKQDYLERHVLPNFGVTWKSYFEKLSSNELPESFVRELEIATKSCPIPYSVDVIFAGFDPDSTRAEIHCIKPGSADDRSHQGYAVIGCGDLIADTEFKVSRFSGYWTKSRSLFLAYLAKRRAEIIEGVGEGTGLWFVEPGKYIGLVPPRIEEYFETLYAGLKHQANEDEETAYRQATDFYKDYEEETRQIKGEIKTGSAATDNGG